MNMVYKNRLNRRLGVLLLALLLLSLLASGCRREEAPRKVGETGTPATAPAPRPGDGTLVPVITPLPEGPDPYQVGDVISVGDAAMAVLGWDFLPGDEFNQPGEGNQFLAVDVLLVNQGESAQSVTPLLQMTLRDATGQQYAPDLRAIALGGGGPGGEISAGERVRGLVGFQTPQGVQDLLFVFDARALGAGRISVALGSEPLAVEPPGPLPGERPQTTFAVGDIVEVGDLRVTVHGATYPPGGERNRPQPGYRFVVVDVTVENRGSEARSISPLLQMYVKTAADRKFTLNARATLASGGLLPDGELAPDQKIRGQVGFQTPEDAGGLVFVFDAHVFNYGKALVALP